jgi:CubicO group peptidase (beta-lactamase class C family)
MIEPLDITSLERHIFDQMSAARVPGLAVAIVRGEEIAYAHGFGVTSVEDGGLPVTPQTLFRIGSITKGLTATATMRLVEAGQLDLDRPVSQYVPWLTFSRPGAHEQISMRLLLSHSAGLPTSYIPFGRRDPAGLEAHIRDDVQRYPFVAPPGKLYNYSNPGVRLAGYILQAVTGRPYTELMQDLVFDPLEMGRTTFDPLVAMTYPLAQSHDRNDDGMLAVQHRFAESTGGYPSGMAISTAVDLAHYAVMHMNRGRFRGRQLLSPASVAEMQAVQADTYTAAGGGYGLALHVDGYKGLRRVSHEGSISTFGTILAMVPDAGVAVVVLFNRAPGFWTRARTIVDQILDGLLDLPAQVPPLPAVAPDRARWPLYSGTYLGDWRGLAVVRAAAGGLTVTWNGAPLALRPLRPELSRAAAGGPTVYAAEKADGEVVSFGFVPEGDRPVEYLQVNSSPCRRLEPDAAFLPAPEAWPAYAGKYVGVDKMVVRVGGDGLLLYSEEADREMPLVPLSKALFASDVGLIEFQVAEDGTVPSLQFGRVFTLTRVVGDESRPKRT